ncbi:MAG: hypothetical protein ACI9R3_004937 [Verrucomicrobiales bacterium]|jgi:hypothetical protein
MGYRAGKAPALRRKRNLSLRSLLFPIRHRCVAAARLFQGLRCRHSAHCALPSVGWIRPGSGSDHRALEAPAGRPSLRKCLAQPCHGHCGNSFSKSKGSVRRRSGHASRDAKHRPTGQPRLRWRQTFLNSAMRCHYAGNDRTTFSQDRAALKEGWILPSAAVTIDSRYALACSMFRLSATV